MPKKVPDYTKGLIYKLVHNEDHDNINIYVGSTTNFIKRKNHHKRDCYNENNKNYNFKVYQHIRINGGFENWVMIQVEPFSCNSKKELETRERYWIESLKPTLNKVIPTRTNKEYKNDNREKILKQRKEYRLDNKEKFAEKGKEYYQDNKEKFAEYYQNNKQKFAEKGKEYYQNNKQKITDYKQQKAKCDKCGCEVTRNKLARHKKTKKCINFTPESN